MKESLRNVTLRQLQIFMTAAEHESYARAAELLHLTQPAISIQMKRLTDMVGLPLFSKHGRELRLTPAGQSLLPYAQQITHTLREAGEELDAINGIRHGLIRLGMVTTTQYFSARLTAEFKKQHPEVELDITIANRQSIISKLENNEIDLAIMGRTPKRLDIDAVEFFEHPHVIIAHPEHHLVGKQAIRAETLQKEPFLGREHGSGTRMLLEYFFMSHDVKQPEIHEFTSNESIKQSVIANIGLALISAHTIHLETQSNLLTTLDVESMPIMRTWFILNLKNKQLSPTEQAFKSFVKDEGPQYMKSIFT